MTNNIRNIERLFELDRAGMRKIIKSFHSEMKRGLAGQKSSLKMIPTYVGMPVGSERGKLLALDLGGTNFRVLEIELKGDGRTTKPRIMKFALGKDEIHGNAETFFGFIAGCLEAFLKKYKLAAEEDIPLGFTFSFPIKQTGIASGILMMWTKGFEAKGVVGSDVVKLLKEALAKRGIKNIRISALVNDTVGTLVAKSYEDRYCDVGVIIGTGTNACYPEKMREIKKWRGPVDLAARMIINIEWGNFNKLAATLYDRELDAASDNPGEQILEKMVSGMYLGEVTQRVLRTLGIYVKNDFSTEEMSAIESAKGASVVKRACSIVSRRAARISASCIAAIITKMDPKLARQHTIAIDGSVFEKHPTFARNMSAGLRDLFGSRASRINLELAKDGSGKGAAIVAAVASR